MLHVCVRTFDVIGTVNFFWELNSALFFSVNASLADFLLAVLKKKCRVTKKQSCFKEPLFNQTNIAWEIGSSCLQIRNICLLWITANRSLYAPTFMNSKVYMQ